MRILLMVAILARDANVRAEVKIADDASRDSHFSSLDYGVNEQLGRAWLVLRLTGDGLCRGSDAPCPFDELSLRKMLSTDAGAVGTLP